MQRVLQNKLLNRLLKALIFVLLFWALYVQVFKNEKLNFVIHHFQRQFSGNYLLLILVLLLMLLNWGIETAKWKYLINKWHELSWLSAIEGILFGITFSMFTPNRVGEFGGRVWALKTDRITAIVSTLIGSYAQLVVNICLGAIAFTIYILTLPHEPFYLKLILCFLLILVVILTHLTLYNIDFVSTKFSRIKIFSKISNYTEVINKYEARDIFYLEVLSVFRFIIYSIQFILLLHFFGITIPFAKGLIITATIFFLQTINPFSVDLLDIGFRGNVAVYFLSSFTNNELGILAATLCLWLINLVLPAIIGGFSVLQFKFLREE
ncbi:MAG TPA: lysylphosphatidylglycerol synthase domain-containing protein [Chitinophagales bacterium]|nr:lysylphosphatidylglycerol synthase domain-containing protein [Chitinophagales bacterium]HNL84432.1 lysylphosphatidylglycerol synthase domain-containing protein [Chitinophagales bacterium]